MMINKYPAHDYCFFIADVLGSAVGWAGVVRGHEGLRAALEAWRTKPNTFSLGVCNGCQLMALLGWLDPPSISGESPLCLWVEEDGSCPTCKFSS